MKLCIHRIAVIIVLTGATMAGMSQSLLLLSEDSSYVDSKFMIEVKGELDYHSNSLTNEFIDKFIFGGEISDELKNEVRSELNSMNRAGGNLIGSLKFFDFGDSLFGRSNYGLFVGLATQIHGRLAFSDELYDISMYGNEQYLGKRADFDGSGADFYAWQEMSLGFFHKRTLSFVSLGLINGQNFSSLDMNLGSLYTSEEGDSLALLLDGYYSRSDTAMTGFGSSNGIGTALNARFNIPLSQDKGFVTIKIENAGFIQWSEETISYESDTIYSFAGVDIEEVFSEDDDWQYPALEDSVYQSVSKGREITILPARISAGINYFIGERDFFDAEISIVPVPRYLPGGRVGYNWFFGDRLLAGVYTIYGGYGNFRFGGQLQWRSESNWYIQLQLADIPGLIFEEAKGRAAQLTVSKFFKSKND